MNTNIYGMKPAKQVELTPGEMIKDALSKKQISQSELAKMMNVSPSAISHWCDDKRAPKPKHRRRLCALLDLDIFKLQGIESSQNHEAVYHDEMYTASESEMISDIRSLDEFQYKCVRMLIDAFKQDNQMIKQKK